MTPEPPPPLLIRDARVLTLAGGGPRRGAELADLAPIDRADVLIEHGRIAGVAPSDERERADAPAGPSVSPPGPPPADLRTIDARGRVLMPGFADAHTHLCWAGDRLDEWKLKQRGATYLELLEAGGGIMSTVRAVREATEAQLADELRGRLHRALREGTVAVEIKSGYGLTTPDELKMLRAAARAAETWPGVVSLTACIGHAIDPDVERAVFVARTIDETLPAVHDEFPHAAIDAYCERGAWSLDECVRLFDRALALGHPVRVHTDQFHALGMTEWAIDRAAEGAAVLSVDHLEATGPETADRLGSSGVACVLLPCSGFHVDGRFAPGRELADAGAHVVVATNANPGSAPCLSPPMAIALATRSLGLTAAEAIAATTANAAALLGLDDAGAVQPGRRADLVLLAHTDERQLGYEFGGSPVDTVICDGEIVAQS